MYWFGLYHATAALTHLLDAPAIDAVSDTSLNGTFPLDAKSLRGRGAVEFFRVQYKVPENESNPQFGAERRQAQGKRR